MTTDRPFTGHAEVDGQHAGVVERDELVFPSPRDSRHRPAHNPRNVALGQHASVHRMQWLDARDRASAGGHPQCAGSVLDFRQLRHSHEVYCNPFALTWQSLRSPARSEKPTTRSLLATRYSPVAPSARRDRRNSLRRQSRRRSTPAAALCRSEATSTGSESVLLPLGSAFLAAGLPVSQTVGQTPPLFHINYLAVIVAAVASFAIGAVWYSPVLFAKHWMAAHGFTLESMTAMRSTMARAYAIRSFASSSWPPCSRYSSVAWALSAPCMEPGSAPSSGSASPPRSDSPPTYMRTGRAPSSIDAGYQLVYMMVMGAILAAWT